MLGVFFCDSLSHDDWRPPSRVRCTSHWRFSPEGLYSSLSVCDRYYLCGGESSRGCSPVGDMSTEVPRWVWCYTRYLISLFHPHADYKALCGHLLSKCVLPSRLGRVLHLEFCFRCGVGAYCQRSEQGVLVLATKRADSTISCVCVVSGVISELE